MSKKQPEKRVFNLLKPVEPPQTAWDKVYEWLIGKARVVILVTELVIAVAFIFKVIEDTNAKNKEKQIEKLNAELSFYGKELEPIFRITQRKVADYVTLWNGATDYTEALQEVYSYISNPSSDITIRIDEGSVSVFGYENLAALEELETSLKGSATFSSVQVQQLSLEESGVIEDRGQYAVVAKIADFKRTQL